MDVCPNPLTGVGTRDAGHQKLVVVGVLVAHCSDDGTPDRLGIQRPPRRGASDSATAARTCVASDHLGAAHRAAWEQFDDPLRHKPL